MICRVLGAQTDSAALTVRQVISANFKRVRLTRLKLADMT